ncbi:MAG: sensor histidine kinase [Solirubrobacteraceae bacterium]
MGVAWPSTALPSISRSLAVAALSIVGLSTQHRLDPRPLVFCVALVAPLLLHRRDPRACFATVALVALLQWLFSVPQLADFAVLISLYWVALESDLTEVALAAPIVEAGAIMAALRWSPSESLKVWVGLTGLGTADGASYIPVTMDLDGDPHDLPEGIQLTVFRVVQEALTNTLKHAARPASTHLALHCHSGGVELEVTDTGGSAPISEPGQAARSGRGLRGMRERAAAYGGRLDAGPAPDGGWRVHLRLQPDVEPVSP